MGYQPVNIVPCMRQMLRVTHILSHCMTPLYTRRCTPRIWGYYCNTILRGCIIAYTAMLLGM